MSREMAEKIKIEEEKKRKRAEKFGIAKPVENGTNATEPVRHSVSLDLSIGL